MKNSGFKKKGCSNCGSPYHGSLHCTLKPRSVLSRPSKPMRRESVKTRAKRQHTSSEWDKLNPPDENGEWTCYLQISPLCPRQLTIETLVREHVKPKHSHKHLQFDVTNIKPSCTFCNGVKIGKSLETLSKEYPHLKKYIKE